MATGTLSDPIPSGEPMKVAQMLLRNSLKTPKGFPGIKTINGQPMIWAAGRWKHLSLEDFDDLIWRETEDLHYQEGERVRRWAPNLSKVANLSRALKARTRVPHRELPVWLEKASERPDPRFCVGFEDVVVDVQTMEVVCERDETWLDHCTLPVKWNPEAGRRLWEQTLEEWGRGDPLWVECCQRIWGQVLMPYRGFGRWAMFMGKIRGGKGVNIRLMKRLLGETGVRETTMQGLAGTYGAAGLDRARVLAVGEVTTLERADGSSVAALVKHLVGRDAVTINPGKYASMIEGLVSPAFVIMSSNQIPRMPDESGGLSGKMVVLPFTVSFVGRENHLLEDQLVEELEGIAAWAVEGAHKLVKALSGDRWPMPERGVEEVRKYRLLNSLFDSFLEARFVTSGEGFVPSHIVKAQWEKWAKEMRLGARDQVAPTQLMARIESESSWDVTRAQGTRGAYRNKRGLKGISLRREFDDEV